MHSRSVLFVVLAWSLACSALPHPAKSIGGGVQTLASPHTRELKPRSFGGLSFLLGVFYCLNIASDSD